MMTRYRSAICIYGKYMQNNLPLMLGPINCPSDRPQPVRTIKKHWNPKWKKERREKFIKVQLPDYEKVDEAGEDMLSEEMRSRMKQRGIFPQKQWSERPAYMSCTPIIFESYVAPEGDGKFSAITKDGAKQKFEFFEKKSKSYMAIRKIKQFDGDFTNILFLEEALNIYIKAHEALADKDKEKLIQYVTETAYPKITHNLMDKTVRWKFLESLEPARIVHARCVDMMSKENVYAQLTVRFHTQQVLSIYDRFGRLMQGSEILKKDVLEYVVFEKHLANEYGVWRIQGKIIPNWMPSAQVIEKTWVLPEKKPPAEPVSESVAEIVNLPDTKDTTLKPVQA